MDFLPYLEEETDIVWSLAGRRHVYAPPVLGYLLKKESVPSTQ